jgi:hypothetical protein
MSGQIAALDLIAAERRRQVEALGYSAERDDGYEDGELASAAAAYAEYAARSRKRNGSGPAPTWPWGLQTWTPSRDGSEASRIRELTKAGALIVAEIERLQRLQAKGGAA